MGDRLLLTGVVLDWLAGRPPRFETAWDHWRTGFVKGAIYGALFMGFFFRRPDPAHPRRGDDSRRRRVVIGPLLGALLSARPDDRRQRRRHAAVLRPARARLSRSARLCARAVVGLGLALAFAPTSQLTTAARAFSSMSALGALAYGGVDFAFDAGAC